MPNSNPDLEPYLDSKLMPKPDPDPTEIILYPTAPSAVVSEKKTF
jgi:hypothetical protein